MKTGWTTSRSGLAAWTSVLALCAWPHAALADCVPVPPMDNDIVVCTGGSEGFSTAANNLTVDVQSGGLTPIGDIAFEFTGNNINFTNSIFLGGSVIFQLRSDPRRAALRRAGGSSSHEPPRAECG